MARSSWTQSNFLGGEWSPSAQGRLDLPEYKTALDQSRNGMPQEEGSWVRRSGTRMCGPTPNGQFGVNFSWDIAGQAIYDIEISVSLGQGSVLRLWQGDQPLLSGFPTTVTAITPTFPAVLTLVAPVTWNTGDIVLIQIGAGMLNGTTDWAPILNRQLQVTQINSTHYSIPIDGSTLPGTLPAVVHIGKIAAFSVPQWTTVAQLFNICPLISTFNNELQCYFFCLGAQPAVLTLTVPGTSTTWPSFSVTNPYFQGPYQEFSFDQNGVVSAATGIVTLTSSGPVQPNGGAGFLATDAGRAIRLLSQPPPYNSGTTYSAGSTVMWQNVSYFFINGTPTAGKQPDLSPTFWAIDLGLIQWVDTMITAFIDNTHVSVDLSNFTLLATNGLGITTFTLGVYTANVWPSCGTFHEGRLWLTGAVPNEVDASEVQLPTSFRPTDFNGNVLDSSAISYSILSPSNNRAVWMAPDQQGIVLGTQAEEWLITSTANNNILTPTTMQAHRVTKFGSYFAQPVHAGLSYIFIERYGNIILEYLADTFSQRLGALPINAHARTVSNFVSKLAYTANTVPVIWARTFSGGLSGCTYRRTSRFLNQPPDFHGWHQHSLSGVAPFVSSISESAYPGPGGTIIEALAITTGTGFLSGTFYRQILMPSYNPLIGDVYAWHLDGAATGLYQPNAIQPTIFVGLSAVEDGANMYFLGLWYQPSTVSVYVAGIYFGDFPVFNGAVTVPYGSDPGGLGTRAYLATQVVQSGTNGACFIQGLGTLPTLIGSKYISTVKLLRQDVQDEARTPTGMAVGELRRPYQASAHVAVGYNNEVMIGVDDQLAYPMVFRQYPGGPANPNNVRFHGIWQDTVNADESLDGQLVLNITGPYPFVLNNITPFAETEER